LFLTPLSGENLLTGKYASVMIAAMPMAMAAVPIFAISLLWGGVNGSQVARAGLGLMHALSISVIVGVMTSCNSKSSGIAMAAALFALSIGAFIAGVFLSLPLPGALNPMTPVFGIWEPKIEWIDFVCALLIWQLVFFYALQIKGRAFPKQWRDEEEAELRFANFYQQQKSEPIINRSNLTPAQAQPTYDAVGTPKWFGGNPIEWLTLREMGMHTGPWVFTLAAAVCAAFAFFTPIGVFYLGLLTFALALYLCIAAARPFAVARQCNSVELIATTPIGYRGMIAGHLSALKKVFLWPALIVCSTFAGLLMVERFQNRGFSLPFFSYFLIGVILLFAVTPWVGMWMGLKAKTPTRAVLGTITLVFLVPRIGVCALDAPYFFVLGLVAHHAVQANFQKVFSERYS
jgi:hypothetical protein